MTPYDLFHLFLFSFVPYFSNLVEASNIDKKPDIKKLENILSKAVDMKSRNKLIVQSYEKGYSQHMIAKVLGVSQAAIYGVIKRSRQL